jgi:hypothetical protein
MGTGHSPYSVTLAILTAVKYHLIRVNVIYLHDKRRSITTQKFCEKSEAISMKFLN